MFGGIDLWNVPQPGRRRLVPFPWCVPDEQNYELTLYPLAIIEHDGAWAGFDVVGDRITEWYVNREDAYRQGEQHGYHPFYVVQQEGQEG